MAQMRYPGQKIYAKDPEVPALRKPLGGVLLGVFRLCFVLLASKYPELYTMSSRDLMNRGELTLSIICPSNRRCIFAPCKNWLPSVLEAARSGELPVPDNFTSVCVPDYFCVLVIISIRFISIISNNIIIIILVIIIVIIIIIIIINIIINVIIIIIIIIIIIVMVATFIGVTVPKITIVVVVFVVVSVSVQILLLLKYLLSLPSIHFLFPEGLWRP
jgi:hypothetical protein